VRRQLADKFHYISVGKTMAMKNQEQSQNNNWPPRPVVFAELLTPIEAAQYLRLDETGNHTPQTAIRTLNYWRYKGQLKATKYARRVWYRKAELDRFLTVKTEE
jgi:hypothetical protein